MTDETTGPTGTHRRADYALRWLMSLVTFDFDAPLDELVAHGRAGVRCCNGKGPPHQSSGDGPDVTDSANRG